MDTATEIDFSHRQSRLWSPTDPIFSTLNSTLHSDQAPIIWRLPHLWWGSRYLYRVRAFLLTATYPLLTASAAPTCGGPGFTLTRPQMEQDMGASSLVVNFIRWCHSTTRPLHHQLADSWLEFERGAGFEKKNIW